MRLVVFCLFLRLEAACYAVKTAPRPRPFSMQKYDLIVIGSGPAGQRAAVQGAKCGHRVVVIEQRSIVGGTCINTGTIPSKTMREAVLHLSGYYSQGIYGANFRAKEKVTVADLGSRVNQVIKTEADVTEA